MRQWEAQINRLIKEVARKRGSERVGSGMSRILSANSTSRYNTSNPSFGYHPATRPPLRSHRLGTSYENSNGFPSAPPSNAVYRHVRSPTRSSSNPTVNNGLIAPPINRSRSLSQPGLYNPPSKAVPSVPNGSPNWSQGVRSLPGTPINKRGSGSSQSTAESSDYSPNSSFPITPYGSIESSLGGDVDAGLSPSVKVQVHFHEDIFVFQVPRTTDYGDLVEKVGRKIRLCGPRRDDGPLRVKYRDEDGDMVSLGLTEDVQMAFEAYRPGPGGQVTLFVT
jgi:cell division control protein 24